MTGSTTDLLADLDARGLVHQTTDRDALAARLAERPITLYCGFDPTADSLHIGNLVPLLLLRRFQDAGHHALALAGGATGMIGDPSGRSEERNLLDAATLEANVTAIEGQLRRFLDFDPARPNPARLVDNHDWTAPTPLLEFLRDVGKHVTVNQMISKESVRARLDSEHGISFTEFTYMLLQANDFWWLHEHEGCELQVGGSDQWGNMTAGTDLIRRRSGGSAHVLTVPLVTRADGAKFGKTAAGAVWLAADRTSPYQLFQYFMNVDDRDVERFLLQLTFLPVEECRTVAAAHAQAPGRRDGQRRLAVELTTLLHGPGEAEAARQAAAVLFGGSLDDVGPATFEMLAGELPVAEVGRSTFEDGADPVDLLVAAGLVGSKGEARRTLAQGGAYVNNERLGAESGVPTSALAHGRWLLLRKGKRDHALVRAV